MEFRSETVSDAFYKTFLQFFVENFLFAILTTSSLRKIDGTYSKIWVISKNKYLHISTFLSDFLAFLASRTIKKYVFFDFLKKIKKNRGNTL